jgi:hypothetical protein
MRNRPAAAAAAVAAADAAAAAAAALACVGVGGVVPASSLSSFVCRRVRLLNPHGRTPRARIYTQQQQQQQSVIITTVVLNVHYECGHTSSDFMRISSALSTERSIK